jgi:hypothetical protein
LGVKHFGYYVMLGLRMRRFDGDWIRSQLLLQLSPKARAALFDTIGFVPWSIT